MRRMEKIATTERIIEEYLERYESEAIDLIDEYCCPYCPLQSEDCSPCERMGQIILQTEESIASRKAVLN